MTKIAKKASHLHRPNLKNRRKVAGPVWIRDPRPSPGGSFFRFPGPIFSQNGSAFHLSKPQVSSSNRLKVIADLSFALFFQKIGVYFGSRLGYAIATPHIFNGFEVLVTRSFHFYLNIYTFQKRG